MMKRVDVTNQREKQDTSQNKRIKTTIQNDNSENYEEETFLQFFIQNCMNAS